MLMKVVIKGVHCPPGVQRMYTSEPDGEIVKLCSCNCKYQRCFFLESNNQHSTTTLGEIHLKRGRDTHFPAKFFINKQYRSCHTHCTHINKNKHIHMFIQSHTGKPSYCKKTHFHFSPYLAWHSYLFKI